MDQGALHPPDRLRPEREIEFQMGLGRAAIRRSSSDRLLWASLSGQYGCFNFQDLAPLTGVKQAGNSPRYFKQLRTDGINNIDFSLFKDFRLRESMLLQFRAEFFNFFNTPRFGSPDTSYGSSDFGFIYDQSNRPRNGQIGIRFVW